MFVLVSSRLIDLGSSKILVARREGGKGRKGFRHEEQGKSKVDAYLVVVKVDCRARGNKSKGDECSWSASRFS